MRVCFALPLLGMLGLACGSIVGTLNTSFIANCGENCPDDPLLWMLGSSVVFPAIGHLILSKTRRSLFNTALIAIALAMGTLLPALALYGYKLHKEYWSLYGKQVYPDQEYSHMVISEEPLPSLGIREAERCAINVDHECGELLEAIPAMCQSGFVSIPRQHWSSFKRLPEEDLQGLAPDAKAQKEEANMEFFLTNLCR